MVHSEHFDYRIPISCFLKHQQENVDSTPRSVSESRKTFQESESKTHSVGEIDYWKQKSAQTEEENFILAQKIQELETDITHLFEKYIIFKVYWLI